MKWINHRIVSGAVVFAITDDLLLAVCAAAGAVVPDKVEGYPMKNYNKWKKRHRGVSHVPLIYLGGMFLIYALWEANISPVDISLPAAMGMAFLAGAALHIFEDALCGKVPIIFPKSRHGIRLFTVGSAGEYVFTATVLILILYLKFGDIAEKLRDVWR